jgi:hypothetical protein
MPYGCIGSFSTTLTHPLSLPSHDELFNRTFYTLSELAICLDLKHDEFNVVSDDLMQYLEIVQRMKHEGMQRMKTQRDMCI